ncbi:Aste57867_15150 [Aphanomyces stellatus]|uniref:Aste57867_15150 protein n=1 Tax=Aphanomyces stellatus TaxID=120398 RepID=A0A485L2H1_9STRA|nr:hypothetical protein As57867_015094 [Aphanomyces stellatus]VFT91959.1 Aste57867_15150 [Aphanomyces stellatus]
MSGISIGASLSGAMPKETFKPLTSMAMHRVDFPSDIDDETAGAMIPHIVGHRGAKITAAGVTSNCTLKLKIAKVGARERSYISVAGQNVLRANHGARLAQQLIDDAHLLIRSKKLAAPVRTVTPPKPKKTKPTKQQPQANHIRFPVDKNASPTKRRSTGSAVPAPPTEGWTTGSKTPAPPMKSRSTGSKTPVPPQNTFLCPSQPPSAKPAVNKNPMPALLQRKSDPSNSPNPTVPSRQTKRMKLQESTVNQSPQRTPVAAPVAPIVKVEVAAPPTSPVVKQEVILNHGQARGNVQDADSITVSAAAKYVPSESARTPPRKRARQAQPLPIVASLETRHKTADAQPPSPSPFPVAMISTSEEIEPATLHAPLPKDAPSKPRKATSLQTWPTFLTSTLAHMTAHAASYVDRKKQVRAAKRQWRDAAERVTHLESIHASAARVPLSQRTSTLPTADLKRLARRMRIEAAHAGMPSFLHGVVPFASSFWHDHGPHPYGFLDPLVDIESVDDAALHAALQANDVLEATCRRHEELVAAAASTAHQDVHGCMQIVLDLCGVWRQIVLHRVASKELLCRGIAPAAPHETQTPTGAMEQWRQRVVATLLPRELRPEMHPLVQRTCDLYPYLLPLVLGWTSAVDAAPFRTSTKPLLPNDAMARLRSCLVSCKMPYPRLLEHERDLRAAVVDVLVALTKQHLREWADLVVDHPELLALFKQAAQASERHCAWLPHLPGYDVPPHQFVDDDEMVPSQTMGALAGLAHQFATPRVPVDI